MDVGSRRLVYFHTYLSLLLFLYKCYRDNYCLFFLLLLFRYVQDELWHEGPTFLAIHLQKGSMELAVINNLHHTEGLTRD